ncbi:MAG: cytochrome b/b6 domain-containing protein [Betaproteobacteria bacterium]|nr:cytochrome b/b6 domain-containing protein [Betaproteobacteria bacterium]
MSMSEHRKGMLSIRVWDFPTRLFHWSLVLLVSFSGITGEFGDDFGAQVLDWHARSGYAILTLLLFRLMWGFVGGTHARFRNFLRAPQTVIAYLRELRQAPQSRLRPGHNPLGGWSVAAMLTCLALQVGTGLFLTNDDLGFEGPLARHIGSHLADQLKALHAANFIVLLILIALHLFAIGFYYFSKGENLLRPMLTGDMPVAEGAVDAPSKGGHTLLGAAVMAIGAALAWFIVTRL